MGRATGFDFTSAMQALCVDMTQRCPDFAHIRMEHIAVCFAQARTRMLHGLQAKLTPMRFEGGSLTTRRGRSAWTVRRMFCGRSEVLYILTFYLPRFLDQSFSEKLITIFHELYHISPQFNGDIRRLDGRYHVHSHSQREYDREMANFAEQYLAKRPPEKLLAFLRRDFAQTVAQHGSVIGLKVPIPRLIRLPQRESA